MRVDLGATRIVAFGAVSPDVGSAVTGGGRGARAPKPGTFQPPDGRKTNGHCRRRPRQP